MNISISAGSDFAEAPSEQGSAIENMSCRVTDYELIECLISLAEMLDTANEKIEIREEKPEATPSRDQYPEQEGFSFLSGWDRLMNRFRDSCTNRNLYRVCF